MKTKLVYVLTCDQKDHYIEQALASVYSARYWNPDAIIVLLVDDKTNMLLSGKRAEILDYISEKIVIPLDEEKDMVYRSRWIKTNVRCLIEGDFLFIDCDTIIKHSLEEIDGFTYEIGAVLESQLEVKDFCESLYQHTKKRTDALGVDLDVEGLYFNSGVMYVKDSPITHQLYDLWHTFWQKSMENGLFADQPSLSKANREVGRIIQRIPNSYNCMLWIQSPQVGDSKILHISSYRNPSFLFSDKVLSYIERNGLGEDWVIRSILDPCSTFLPFDYSVYHSNKYQRKEWKKSISTFLEAYGKNIDPSYEDFKMSSKLRGSVVWLLRQGHSFAAISVWLYWKYLHLHLKKKHISDNVCRK